jgi:hypothetical protein
MKAEGVTSERVADLQALSRKFEFFRAAREQTADVLVTSVQTLSHSSGRKRLLSKSLPRKRLN